MLQSNKYQKYYQLAYILLFSLIAFVLTITPINTFIRSIYGYVLDPQIYWIYNLKNSVVNFENQLSEFDNLTEENFALKVENAELKSKILFVQDIFDQNVVLKEQANISSSSKKLILTKVLDNSDLKLLKCSSGSEEGVNKGDLVVLGDLYIGEIKTVYKSYSNISTPLNGGGYIKVKILPRTLENISLKDTDANIENSWDAVIIGKLDGISIENISPEADVKEGFVVITNDENISGEYIIGTIAKLNNAPGMSMQKGELEPIINYKELKYIFILSD